MGLFMDLEEYIGETIYSLVEQGTDQSMAETIRQFITTQVFQILAVQQSTVFDHDTNAAARR